MSDYLLPEVVSEILKRVPVKSLLRFRCVCKDWCSLISSPNFISQQLSHSSFSSHALVRRYSKLHSKEIYTLFQDHTFNLQNTTRLTFPFHGKTQFYFRIVGVCNGLLCLSDDLFGYNETVILWNPSIKRAITLPTPRAVFNRCGSYTAAIGFGFDSQIDDYKVVRVAYLLSKNKRGHALPPRVEVFSISSNVWRQVKNNVKSCITEHFWSQTVVRGAVHWVAYKMSDDDELFLNVILKFDLHTEKFVEMGLPEDLLRMPPFTVLAATVKGLFSLVYNDEFLNLGDLWRGNCDIWVMKDYGNVESWSKVYNVNLGTGLSRIVGVKSDCEYLFSGGSGELVSYHSENKAVTGTGIYGTKDSFYVTKYAESLVLLGKGKKAEKSEPDYEDEDERVEHAEYRHKVISFGLITTTIKRI